MLLPLGRLKRGAKKRTELSDLEISECLEEGDGLDELEEGDELDELEEGDELEGLEEDDEELWDCSICLACRSISRSRALGPEDSFLTHPERRTAAANSEMLTLCIQMFVFMTVYLHFNIAI